MKRRINITFIITIYLLNFVYCIDDTDEPWSPKNRNYEGPWLRTQIGLALLVGLPSFLLFCSLRTNSTVLFAPRTKLKGFSPHEAHDTSSFFGWILPTLRTSEYTVLQIVGLDAAVLLNFLKMSFWFFSVAAVVACPILVPINYRKYGTWEASDDADESDNNTALSVLPSFELFDTFDMNNNDSHNPWDALTRHKAKWRKIIDLFVLSNTDAYLGLQLIFTFLFSILALRFVHKNYNRFVRQRQLFSLELIHAISARTVMIESLPRHLRDERLLSDYFDSINLKVESVQLVKGVKKLDKILTKRTKALLELESAYSHYLGNPSQIDFPNIGDIDDVESQQRSYIDDIHVPNKPRPFTRSGIFGLKGVKLDKIKYYESLFENLDKTFKIYRKSNFKSTHVAFVTFENASSAQISTQSTHYPEPGKMVTKLAPEPRDLVWENVAISSRSKLFRRLIVYTTVTTLLLTWAIPVTALYTLLSYNEIARNTPWLARLIDKSPSLRALVQTSLPPLALVIFNAVLPLFLHWLCVFQGHKARSHIEYSLMKKYFMSLVITVVLASMTTATYLMVRELADAPLKIPDKLAQSLKSSKARHFFVSYVILQGLGILPLQLLQLNIVLPKMIFRPFTKTPRDWAELNAPPELNYGTVYPQAILVFVIGLLYSIMSPYILIAAAVYFGVAYLVYKYKVLFIFYKPWESSGQAWPITYARCCWGVVLFQVFMLGLFTLQGAFLYTSILLTFITGTVFWSFNTEKKFRGLSSYVNLSSLYEAHRGTTPTEIVGLRYDQSVPRSQSNLNRRRYAMNDATLYVAPETDKTDYSQPPMRYWYYGVLNTGRRRYDHPALNGILPELWLPTQKKKQHEVSSSNGRVLTLRKRWSKIKRSSINDQQYQQQVINKRTSANSVADPQNPFNPWIESSNNTQRDEEERERRLRTVSYDGASGVIALPEGDLFISDEDESEDEESEENNYNDDNNNNSSNSNKSNDNNNNNNNFNTNDESNTIEFPTT